MGARQQPGCLPPMPGLSPAAPGASGGDLGSLETRLGLFYLALPLSPAVCHPGSRANSGLGVWGGQPGRAAGDALSLGDGEGCTVGFGRSQGTSSAGRGGFIKRPFTTLRGGGNSGDPSAALGCGEANSQETASGPCGMTSRWVTLLQDAYTQSLKPRPQEHFLWAPHLKLLTIFQDMLHLPSQVHCHSLAFF